MKKITDEEFNSLWVDFRKYYDVSGLGEVQNPEDLKEAFKIGAAALGEDSGVAYPGALLSHIVMVCALSQRIAKMVSGTFHIENSSLMKVCILHQLAKLEMIIPNDNEWEREKRGLNYKFNNLEGVLKVGERSAWNAMNAGVRLSALEFEAIRGVDKDSEEVKFSKSHNGILTVIVRVANDLAYTIERERWVLENKGK